MNYLFIHRNLPGQYEHLINALLNDPDSEIIGICQEYVPQQHALFGLRVIQYETDWQSYRGFQEAMACVASDLANGHAVAAMLTQLKLEGFRPDVAFSHLGWGEASFFKDVYPDTPLVGYCEFYYRSTGSDADFYQDRLLTLNDRYRIRSANAAKLMGLVSMDAGTSPTEWQKSLYPSEFQSKIRVVHEGVPVSRIKPDPNVRFRLASGEYLTRQDLVITYASRNLEPQRGFPTLVKMVDEICRRRTDCQFVIAGGDEVSYSESIEGLTYREKLLRETPLDPSRVHFVGRLMFDDYVKMLQVSSVHVYLTVPFALSWSMIEAMAAGCAIVGSDTQPVNEVIQHGRNGLLADFFSPALIAGWVDELLDNPSRRNELGLQARGDVMSKFTVTESIRNYRRLIASLN